MIFSKTIIILLSALSYSTAQKLLRTRQLAECPATTSYQCYLEDLRTGFITDIPASLLVKFSDDYTIYCETNIVDAVVEFMYDGQTQTETSTPYYMAGKTVDGTTEEVVPNEALYLTNCDNTLMSIAINFKAGETVCTSKTYDIYPICSCIQCPDISVPQERVGDCPEEPEDCECPGGSQFDANYETCVCPDGLELDGNVCVSCSTCPQYSVPSAGITCPLSAFDCDCVAGFVKDVDGLCVCAEGTELQGDTCVVCGICPEYSVPSAGVTCPQMPSDCDCIAGFEKSDDVCVCPLGTELQVDTCVQCNSCPQYSVPSAGITCPQTTSDCDCISGFEKDIDGACVCPEGTELQGDTCVECGICPEYSDPIVTCPQMPSDCACQAGFEKNNDVCVCPSGTELQGGNCIQCRTCPQYSVPSAGVTCPQTASDCDCVDGFVKDAYGTCVCPTDTELQGDVCVKCMTCPQFSVASNTCPQSVSDCDCYDGFEKVGDICMCPKGTTRKGNECLACITCPVYSIEENSVDTCPTTPNDCDCLEGFVKENDICVCPANTSLVGGKCVPCITCPSFSTPSTTCPLTSSDCDCVDGYEKDGNICVEERCPNDKMICQNRIGDMKYLTYRIKSDGKCEAKCESESKSLEIIATDGFTCDACTPPTCPASNICENKDGVIKYNIYRTKSDGNCEVRCEAPQNFPGHFESGYSCEPCQGVPLSCPVDNICGTHDGANKYSLFRPKSDGSCDYTCELAEDFIGEFKDGYSCDTCNGVPLSCPAEESICQDKGDGVIKYTLYRTEDGECEATCESVDKFPDRFLKDGYSCDACSDIPTSCPDSNICEVKDGATKYTLYRRKSDGTCETKCEAPHNFPGHFYSGYSCNKTCK